MRRFTPPTGGAARGREELFDIFSQESPFQLHKRGSFYEEDLWEKDSPLKQRYDKNAAAHGYRPLERQFSKTDNFYKAEVEPDLEQEDTLKDSVVNVAMILVLLLAVALLVMQFMSFEEYVDYIFAYLITDRFYIWWKSTPLFTLIALSAAMTIALVVVKLSHNNPRAKARRVLLMLENDLRVRIASRSISIQMHERGVPEEYIVAKYKGETGGNEAEFREKILI